VGGESHGGTVNMWRDGGNSFGRVRNVGYMIERSSNFELSLDVVYI
jgi:hypothetical protein